MGEDGNTLTRQKIARRLSEEFGISERMSRFLVDNIFTIMKDALQSGETVKIVRFGTFVPVVKRERKGTNPNTGESVVIPARRTVSFRPSTLLKAGVNAEKEAKILQDRAG